VLLGHVSWALAAEPSGVATIVDGKVIVIRAMSKFEALEGIRLLADDLVHTGKNSFMRIEYDDGTTVDVGAETRLQFNHPARRKFARPGLYLLSGWLKLAPAKTEGPYAPAFGSPRFDVFNLCGVVVAYAAPGSGAIFVEQGTAGWGDRGVRRATTFTLKTGELLSLRQDEAPGLQDHPAPEFIAALPRLFRDALPLRLARFRGDPVPARTQGTFSYSEVQPWLDAEPSVRHQFVSLWRSKVRTEGFRVPLERSLAFHPEWGPVLHPPGPKEASPALATVSAGPAAVLGPLAGSMLQPAAVARH
jgi:hypothetical protein